MIETLHANGEFEQKPNREIEKKYFPLFPERLDQFRTDAIPVEQVYLSHPSEPFHLRLRETFRGGELVYTAALKDDGTMTEHGLERLEIETEITPETYLFYKNSDTPVIRKLRAEPIKHIAIDWFEDGHMQAESEHPIAWTAFLDQYGLGGNFTEITGDRVANNEWRAHLDYHRQNGGREALAPSPELDIENIIRDILQHQHGYRQTVITLAGRSGSGKTTVIKALQEQLHLHNIRSIVLSTDDYHRGKSWLEHYKGSEWTEWDAPIVYDLEHLRHDLASLQNDTSIARQEFNFHTEEPTLTGVIDPAPVILIEGIYAGDASLKDAADFHYELPTPLATCIGRRLLRDLRERPQFANPEKSLRYILEQAEPNYRNQSV